MTEIYIEMRFFFMEYIVSTALIQLVRQVVRMRLVWYSQYAI